MKMKKVNGNIKKNHATLILMRFFRVYLKKNQFSYYNNEIIVPNHFGKFLIFEGHDNYYHVTWIKQNGLNQKQQRIVFKFFCCYSVRQLFAKLYYHSIISEFEFNSMRELSAFK